MIFADGTVEEARAEGSTTADVNEDADDEEEEEEGEDEDGELDLPLLSVIFLLTNLLNLHSVVPNTSTMLCLLHVKELVMVRER